MLGTIDFSGVKDLESPVGTFDGQTVGWEAKPSKSGDSTNVVATFEYTDGEGNTRKHTQYWNLKPAALWRIKRDLIKMGADPEEFESTDVDLESILNDLFSPPGTPVRLTFRKQPDNPQFSELYEVEAIN